MSKFIILGPAKLSGEIKVFGAKNAAMKMIAASVLIKEKITLKNVPNISDINNIIDILVENGAKISRDQHSLTIDTSNLSSNDPNYIKVKRMRGSVVLIGPYLARFGKISIPQPGGCTIGVRSIDTHLDAFKQLGAIVDYDNDIYSLALEKNNKNTTICLKEASVTATENIIMTVALGDCATTLKNAAKEPEIVDLVNFLNSSGAKIVGAGTDIIKISGVNHLNSTTYEVMPDRIETGTFIALSIVSKSPFKINNCRPEDMSNFLKKVLDIGVKYSAGKDWLQLTKFDNLISTDISTAIHPGFPTDLQAPMGVVLTQVNGKSKISENLFENRLSYLSELTKMGANINIINNKNAEITGPTQLKGTNLESLDLRSGATMILAALCAKGKTEISHAEIIDRGYEKIEERLRGLGANIKRE